MYNYRVIVKILNSAGKVCSFPLSDSDVPVDLHEAGLVHLLRRLEGSEHTELIMRLILPVPSFWLGVRVTYYSILH